MDNNDYMMWLSRVLNQNNKRIELILGCFGTPEEVFMASKDILAASKTVSEKLAEKIVSSKDNIEKWIDEREKAGLRYISMLDKKYPEQLKFTTDAIPAGIYVKGTLPDKDEHCLSMIGSRRCSENGKRAALKLSKELAEDGIWIVSGMARGIDSMSHIGALEGKGKTIAALGFGHNHCYPAENRDLMEKIALNGALISEYPPDTPPESWQFIARNRIIAGISEALLVVEAGQKSGTQITVDFALDWGKTVMALPSSIFNKCGAGSNELFREGCPLVYDKESILDEMQLIRVKKETKKSETKEKIKSNLPDDEAEIYALIEDEPVMFDEIAFKSNKSVQDIQYILGMLEIEGLIESLPGNRFVKK